MLPKIKCLLMTLVLLALALTVACAPVTGSEPVAGSQSAAQSEGAAQEGELSAESALAPVQEPQESDTMQPNEETLASAAADEPTPAAAADGDHQIVDGPELTDEALEALPPGQSDAGVAPMDDPQQSEPGPEAIDPSPGFGTPMLYTNEAFKFAVTQPEDFVLLDQSSIIFEVEMPLTAAFSFMNPQTAASDVLEYEIGDLEVRVFQPAQLASIEQALEAAGFLAGTTQQPFSTPHVNGIEVCQTTMVAPGCSYFVSGGGYLYMLIPSTLEGEAMLQTFSLLP